MTAPTDDDSNGLGLAGLRSGLAGRFAEVTEPADHARGEAVAATVDPAAQDAARPSRDAAAIRRLDPAALALADRLLARVGADPVARPVGGSPDVRSRGAEVADELMVVGPGFSHRIAPGSSVVLGRRDDVGRLVVPHPEVSSGHLRLERGTDPSVRVVDLDSTNGTVLVRGGRSTPLSPGRAETLRPGDRLVTGTDVLLCDVVSAEGTSA